MLQSMSIKEKFSVKSETWEERETKVNNFL